MAYVPFAYAANNRSTARLPWWQSSPQNAAIPATFIADRGGATQPARPVPKNYAYLGGKPAQAAPCNFAGVRMPLSDDNSFIADLPHWRHFPPLDAQKIEPFLRDS